MRSGLLTAEAEATARAQREREQGGERDRLRTTSGSRRPWRTWVLSGTAFAVFAAGLGYLTGNETQANTQYAEAHRALELEHHRIEDALAQLATVRGDLNTVNGGVSQSTTALADDALELLAAQTALSQAQAHVAAQGSSITALQSCLAGVEQALNALSVGDHGSALAALEVSTASCQTAVASSG
ncbi:MAG TPA: hypothetical protein VGL48_17260 [Acidimicrobiales bacterium]